MTRTGSSDPPEGGIGEAESHATIDPARLRHLVRQFRDEQNLALGFLAGVAAAAVGAILWAVITYATNIQIGFMAVAVGLLVGYSIRYFGKGIDKIFGIVGAVLALAGCLAGNILTVCIAISRQQDIPLGRVLANLDFGLALEMLIHTSSPVDLLFYGIAVYEGYKFSFRRISEEELARVLQ